MIYFVTFGSAIFALYEAEKHEAVRWSRNTWLILSVIVSVLLAGLRGLTIGTDIHTYMLPAYRLAQSYKFYSFLIYSKEEILYDLTVFVITKLFDNFQMVLGITQLLVIVPIYIVIWGNRKQVSVVCTSAVFYFVFYCNCFNTIRQNIAMAFIFLSVYYLQKNKKWYCLISFMVAFGFHKSAIVGIVILIIYMMLNNTFKRWFYYPIAVVTIIGVMFYDKFVTYAYNFLPFLPQRYVSERYLYRKLNWPITDTILMTVVLLISLALIFKKNIKKDYFLAMMGFMAFCGLWMGNVSVAMDRLFWYFKIFIILILPQGTIFFKKNQINRVIYTFLLIMFLAGYWILYYAILGNAEVYPYKFFWV